MKKLDLYLYIARSQFKEQSARAMSFEGRAGTVLAVSVALSGVVAVVVNFSGNQMLSAPQLAAVFTIGASIMGAIVCSIMVLGPRKGAWSDDPDLAKFAAGIRDMEDQAVIGVGRGLYFGGRG